MHYRDLPEDLTEVLFLKHKYALQKAMLFVGHMNNILFLGCHHINIREYLGPDVSILLCLSLFFSL